MILVDDSFHLKINMKRRFEIISIVIPDTPKAIFLNRFFAKRNWIRIEEKLISAHRRIIWYEILLGSVKRHLP